MGVKVADELFIVDNSDAEWKVLHYLQDWTEIANKIDVATAIETESTLVDRPLKTEIEYRVLAINKSGEGEPSNSEMVVL
jgi:hypothetical protein